MGEQLRMFMTPREIMSEYKPNPADFTSVIESSNTSTKRRWSEREETEGELWDRKAEEANVSGLTDSITTHGVKMPIALDPENRIIRGGHHRLIVANHLNPHQFVPVMHVNTVGQAKQAEATIAQHANDDDVTADWNW